MRKISAGLFITADGVVEGPGPVDNFEYAGWTMAYNEPAVGQAIGESMMASDALLLGRVTYQGFQAAFAHQSDDPMAAGLNAQHKYVVSNTLKSPDWNNSTLISGNVVEEIARLKQQPGKDIAMSGSVKLVQTLLRHKLIDELILITFPVVLGKGQRLFDGVPRTALRLADSKPTPSGVVILRYELESAQ